MTPLAERLARRIAAEGPMRVSEFMAACLTDPEHGYYTTRDPLGAAGDFTTAPEISQMFGELVGLWLAQVWQDIGAPEAVTLAELGPGRGTLMADVLRAAARLPGFRQAARVHLVELSPVLRAAQAATLADAAPVWHDSAAGLPDDRPLLLVANEFFDALPVRQFLRTADGWAERMIGAGPGGLGYGLAPAVADPELDRRFPGAGPDTLVETCAPGEAVIQALAPVIAARGGAALVIDYGDWDGTGDTLQAMTGHAYAPVLETAGAADLTAHVGFRWLAEAAAPLRAAPLATQGAFLERLGITARARALATGDSAAGIVAAHRRLTHPEEMGTLFKVLALTPAGQPQPPGFA
ncbi:class I SAM-dependent methyltransferase [Rhodobacteraceae bacterium 2CG4]|uniref:Class I SAM-dependent methyltransferase n=1 Tax=Halovulum marinum TaxID=2662447 RepID=A0A6L5Z0R2_9RHOB|nr:SAM-dependent methyltransferase [Halovulum marinum]MSU89690.1 class I SAM-dependent methyltransferase [Halovulum marinum]